MRLATRTGLAAIAAAMLAVLLVTPIAVVQFERSLYQRVDRDLTERAESAPILAAVGDRIAASELRPTLNGARITTGTDVSVIGRLPSSGLPATTEPGFQTMSIDGEDWRVLTVTVNDVPTVGAVADVDLVAPLGDVDRQIRQLRRRSLFVGLLVAIGAGVVGLLLGRRATAPLSALRRDAAGIGTTPLGMRTIAPSYGAPDVDDLAGTINDSVGRLAEETQRREAALGSARSFAAAASHELRTPLQASMAQLDLALTSDEPNADSIRSARSQLQRMGSALTAVRALTEVDLVDPSWFVDADLSELADQAVGALSAADLDGATVQFSGDEVARCEVWPDGVSLAVENLVRNALRHGRPSNGAPVEVLVTIDAANRCITVDDNGPGIAAADRDRVVQPFERGTTNASGSGLGLAFAAKVAEVHGGALRISDGPRGGARVELCFTSAER